MDVDEAARLLGVTPDADARTVRRAWRTWARLAHPDVGGDAEHFGRLDVARRVLLSRRPLTEITPLPRLRLREVLVYPRHPALVVAAGLGCMALPVLGLVLPPLLVAAAASIAVAVWAWWTARCVLTPLADRGHRIATVTLVWAPVWVMQVAVSVLVDASLLPVLPLTAVPLAMAVGAINPGAGLWRPVR